MAERRAIKSKIWDDEFFGELPFFDALLWIGIFSRCADDQGRLQDNPALIASQVFPYKFVPAQDVENALRGFGDHIIRYEAHGKKYIQIAKWWENQPMQYAVPSNYPAPDGWMDKYRTYYKGASIVYNWDGKDTPDSQIGVLLYDKLKSLGRFSSWTDYVGSLNTNPNPNHNPNDKSKVKNKTMPQKRATPAGVVFPASLDCDAFKTVWDEWKKYRAEKRQKITDTIQAKQFELLSKYDVNTAIAMLNKSMTNGWTGVFELKPAGATPPTRKRILLDADGNEYERDA